MRTNEPRCSMCRLSSTDARNVASHVHAWQERGQGALEVTPASAEARAGTSLKMQHPEACRMLMRIRHHRERRAAAPFLRNSCGPAESGIPFGHCRWQHYRNRDSSVTSRQAESREFPDYGRPPWGNAHPSKSRTSGYVRKFVRQVLLAGLRLVQLVTS